MDRAELTRRLRAVFVEELEDHVATWNATLLRLERGGLSEDERKEDVKTVFRVAHSLKGASRTVSLPALERYCHELEERLSEVRDEGAPLDRPLLDRLFAAADVWAETARRLRAEEPIGEELFVAPPRRSLPPEPPAVEGAAGLRVPAARLDALLVRAGELSRAARRIEERERGTAGLVRRLRGLRLSTPVEHREPLDQALERLEALHGELNADAMDLARVARETEADVRQLRLTPFSLACAGLDRVVRDAAIASGVESELVIEGGDVEVDRSILTALRAPLVHLVRNAVAHGIERADARRQAGKPAAGRVIVSARLRGSDVQVAVSDDGRGLDLPSLVERARALGMTVPTDERGKARLVFVPGLTTSERVDELSGRGVGLDVVKTEVEGLLGSIDVTTQRGAGTSFVISAPLTRTVVRCLLLRVGGQTFALPTTHVVTLRRVDPRAVHAVEGRNTLLHESEALPFEPLGRVLGFGSPGARMGELLPAVIVEAARDRVTFWVDELRSVEDIVVERLGERLRRVRGISGATVLSDGSTALVLHGGDIIRTALRMRAGGEAPSAIFEQTRPRRFTLLAVDDSLTTLALEKTILESAGYRVLAASDAERAMRLLAEARVDLVVSDVEMPRMNGFELVEAMQARPELAKIPVVLLTALSREEDVKRGLAAGAAAYLVKNAFDQSELLETVQRLLRG